jgi:hypothetical protein
LTAETNIQMSSSKRTPFQDITTDKKTRWLANARWTRLLSSCTHLVICAIYVDPKEVKRQRNR